MYNIAITVIFQLYNAPMYKTLPQFWLQNQKMKPWLKCLIRTNV